MQTDHESAILEDMTAALEHLPNVLSEPWFPTTAADFDTRRWQRIRMVVEREFWKPRLRSLEAAIEQEAVDEAVAVIHQVAHEIAAIGVLPCSAIGGRWDLNELGHIESLHLGPVCVTDPRIVILRAAARRLMPGHWEWCVVGTGDRAVVLVTRIVEPRAHPIIVAVDFDEV